MFLTVLFYTFVAATAIQLTYLFCFSSLLFVKDKKEVDATLPISVIVCAKNEAENLVHFLPSIINQSYPNFEIILINDASSDDTHTIMENFAKEHQNIKIVNVKNNEVFWGNKKYAVTLGIKSASHEHLLFTDADCKPVSKHWISEMANHFTNEKTIVLGYGKYKRIKKSFINMLIRFETLSTAIQYFSYAKLGSPYMGVGRNLAYKRSEFFKTKGFISHIQIKSGDDDLFIQEAANNENTTFCLAANSFTISNPASTLKEWFRQKRRHISTANHYSIKHQLLLGFFFISKLFFYLFALILLIAFSWKIILPIVVFYFLVFMIIYGLTAKRFREKKLLLLMPLLEICLILFQFSIFISNIFSKPTHWK